MKYKISGHEKFPMRYTWLPKAVMALSKDPRIFSNENEDEAMVEMGVGRNMVRSVRFWTLAAGVAEKAGNEYQLTRFGESLFGEKGLDPFMEDIRTLWLIHWNFSTANDPPMLAWDYLLFRWHEPEIRKSAVLNFFADEAKKISSNPSPTTVKDHLDIFINTYTPTRGPKGEIREDNLDSPLTELELIEKIGEGMSEADTGKREPVYAFRREEKADISPELFLYCLSDFCYGRHQAESTVPFREIAIGYGSPGQVFKLPENDLRDRLEGIEELSRGNLAYVESAGLQQVRKNADKMPENLLENIYR